jgi:hypothetical protein
MRPERPPDPGTPQVLKHHWFLLGETTRLNNVLAALQWRMARLYWDLETAQELETGSKDGNNFISSLIRVKR